jgi:signal peptidase complex subunit 2
MLKLFCCGQTQKEDSSKRVVEVALALARLAPRAVQDTFPQPSPRDLKLNLHLTLFLCATTANMAVSTEKISVHSMAGMSPLSHPIPNSLKPTKKLTLPSPDLKNTSDDAIPAYLNSLKFTQSHTLSDTRLALGYSAFAICAATFYWDYKLGFESTKYYTTIAVAVYAILNSILTYWIWGVEKGSVYIGTNKSGERIEVSSKTEKFTPIYNLSVTTYGKGEKKGKAVSIKKPFNLWFDKAGHFVALPFQQMLASGVKIVGEADPTKVVEGKKKAAKVEEESKSMDDKWASLLAESSGVSLDDVVASPAATQSGRKKRGKKA